MSRLNAANNAQSLLDGGISDTDVSMTVLDGSVFPEPPFLITIEDEIIEVGAKSGNVFSSMLRGREGTVAVAHAGGVEVQNRMTSGMYDSLALGEDITAITQELAAHKADYTQLKTDINNVKIKTFAVPPLNSVSVTFGSAGSFLILAHPTTTAEPQIGVYAAHPYAININRWTITTVNASPELTITTGDATLNFANSHGTQQLDVAIIAYNGSVMTTS